MSSIANGAPFSYSGFTSSVAIQPQYIVLIPGKLHADSGGFVYQRDLPDDGHHPRAVGQHDGKWYDANFTGYYTLPDFAGSHAEGNVSGESRSGGRNRDSDLEPCFRKHSTERINSVVDGNNFRNASVDRGSWNIYLHREGDGFSSNTATALMTLPVAAYVTGAKCNNIDWDVANTSTPLEALTTLEPELISATRAAFIPTAEHATVLATGNGDELCSEYCRWSKPVRPDFRGGVDHAHDLGRIWSDRLPIRH